MDKRLSTVQLFYRIDNDTHTHEKKNGNGVNSVQMNGEMQCQLNFEVKCSFNNASYFEMK